MYKKFVKPIFDFILSLIFFTVALPLFLIISIIVFVETKRFPIFKQHRGLTHTNGRVTIYKFQTLKSTKHVLTYSDKNNIEHKYLENQLTLSGRIIRKTGLDELPQLINVLKGEMSLVGPRPLIFEDLDFIKTNYSEIYNLREKIKLKPGITGMWQVNRKEQFNVHSIIYWDLYYARECNLINDLKILLKTVFLILSFKHRDGINFDEPKVNYSILIFLVYFSFIIISIFQIIR